MEIGCFVLSLLKRERGSFTIFIIIMLWRHFCILYLWIPAIWASWNISWYVWLKFISEIWHISVSGEVVLYERFYHEGDFSLFTIFTEICTFFSLSPPAIWWSNYLLTVEFFFISDIWTYILQIFYTFQVSLHTTSHLKVGLSLVYVCTFCIS